jgi:hypothetical protein
MSSSFQFKSGGISIALIASTLVLQLVFFAPLSILAQNFGEFSVRFIDLVLVHLAISAGLIILILLVIRIVKVPILPAVMTLLSTIAFLEARFFLSAADHHPFNGQPFDWDALQHLSNIELGVTAVLAVAFVAIYKRIKLLSTVSLFILLFLTAGFVFTLVINWEPLQTTRDIGATDALYYDQFYRLSDQRNVIHIVPDQAQGALLHDILSNDDERYSRAFDGFTLFTQAQGQYESTYPTVLLYMSGEAPRPDHDLVLNLPFTREYIAETLEQSSIVTLLSQNAFNTFGFQFHPGIFCQGSYTACTGTHDEVFAGVPANSSARRLVLTVRTALDLALFQTTPIVVRKRVYDNGRWFFRKLDKNTATHSGILDIFTSKMRVGNYPFSYNYFHHAGAHAPLLFDRNCSYTGPRDINLENQREQVKCTLLQLENMVDALKELGVYDQTMIVINGDHGTPELPVSYPRQSGNTISDALMGKASALVLIKPPGERGRLSFSNKAVTTGDIPATIAGELGIENSYPGVQMFKHEPAPDRERYFFTYDSGSQVHYLQALPNMKRYRIRGNLFDERDWVLPDTTDLQGYPSRLNVDDADFPSYAQGFSWLEVQDVPRRWVDGTRARVLLSPPPGGAHVLVFNSHVPSSVTGQWMEVSIGARLIARLDERELRAENHRIILPDDLAESGALEIEFKMGKTISSKQDSRQLSVLFSHIGIESTD